MTTVDAQGDTGYHPSLALDNQGRAHIAYADWSRGDLRYARWDGERWAAETVVSAGNTGGTPSLFIDKAGTIHVSYYDYDKGDLWYAWRSSSGWTHELVDSAGFVGLWSSLKVDAEGVVHIAYQDISAPEAQGGMNLKYANRSPQGVWWRETVDSNGDVGQFADLVIDSQGKVHIAYLSYLYGGSLPGSSIIEKVVIHLPVYRYSPAEGNVSDFIKHVHLQPGVFLVNTHGLKYARRDCANSSCTVWNWAIETVDITGWSGFHPSMVVDSFGKIHIAHHDAKNQNLRYSVKPQGGSWTNISIDSTGDVGQYPYLALTNQGQPQVVYYDVTGDEHTQNCADPLPKADEICHHHRAMKYARFNGSSWSFETIWSTVSYGGTYWDTALAIDSKGIGHIAFTDGQLKDLRYVRWSNAPALSWAGETGFAADGVDPQEGNTFSPFRFRVKYSDPDGDIPLAEYPKVHVFPAAALAGHEIAGSPFSMTPYSGSGAKQSFEKVLWLPAGNYLYYFEAYDRWGVKAKGAPTSNKSGPSVKGVDLPAEEERIFAYPNPARGDKVTFHFVLDQLNPQIELKIFDLSGALVRSIPSDQIAKFSAPVYEYIWDMRDEQGSSVASGMYVYFVHSKGESGTGELKKVKRFAILK